MKYVIKWLCIWTATFYAVAWAAIQYDLVASVPFFTQLRDISGVLLLILVLLYIGRKK